MACTASCLYFIHSLSTACLYIRDSDIKKDWEDCIVSIDDKGMELKRKLKRQQGKQ